MEGGMKAAAVLGEGTVLSGLDPAPKGYCWG
jgi:hypothetical protein